MKIPFAQTMLLCAPGFLTVTATSTLAQTDKTENRVMENVVVIESRQAYQGAFTALETPQAELTIDAEALQNAGAFNLNQALDLSASVARQNNFGGLWNSFALRGFVGDENLPSNYLVNGFNAGRGFGGPRDLSGIESVEVLKGPRAALFGRGEPGGTINLVTKRPTFEKKGELRLSAGRFDTYRTDADWTSPLSDSLAIRMVGFYEDAGSFRDTVETRKQGFSPSLVYRFNNQSQIIYELEYSHQEIPFDRGVVAIGSKLGRIPESRFLGEPGDGPMEADVLGHQIEFQHDFNDDWSALVGMNYRDTSLEGYATENGFGGVDEDGNLGRFRRYRDYDATYQVLRAEISGSFNTAGLAHRIVVGLDADEFENDQVFLRIRNRESNQEINVFNPVYGAYPLPAPLPNTDRVETQKSVGFFLQDQLSLSEKLDMRFGVRYDDYTQELENRRSNTVSEQTEHRVSPQFGIVYQASESISVYAAYGENFRPLSGVDASTGEGFDPNQTTSAELGIKFELNNGSLIGTVAVFNVEQENISGVASDGSFDPVAIGEAESEGIEIDLNGEIAKGVNLWFSYAYIDAKTSNVFNDPNFGVSIPAGSALLNIPEQQFNLQLSKATALAGRSLTFGGGLLYVGERNGYFGQDFDLPAYTTVRAFAAYDMTDAIELRLDIDNLFDKEYYSNSFADVWVQPGTPRKALLSATLRF